MYKAMNALTPIAYKLWCYLNVNQNEYEFDLSSIDVRPKCNIGRSSYYAAVNELIEKGYLIQVELYDGILGYLFVENGQ